MANTLLERVIPLLPEQAIWPFEDGQPYFQTRQRQAWQRSIKFHPFPCYAHDAELVRETAAAVEAAYPVPEGFAPDYYILPFDTVSQTNGWACQEFIYNGDAPRTWESHIVLAGKRIPLHPAMTRYLVAHEYGHVADYWICHKRGIKDDHPLTEFDREYAAMRGLDPNGGYGGLRWHENIGEIIANDFRIMVCGVEPEFWPHPGIARPECVDAVVEFWIEEIRANKAQGCAESQAGGTD